MGADPTAFAKIYRALADDYDQQHPLVQAERRRIAKVVRKAHATEDFNDDDLDEYEALVTLGLAKRCRHCGEGLTDYSRGDHVGGACAD